MYTYIQIISYAFRKFFIVCIKGYVSFRPRRYPVCRFLPSCSNYAVLCLQNFGLFYALYCIGVRILKCHPWFAQDGFCLDEPCLHKSLGEQ